MLRKTLTVLLLSSMLLLFSGCSSQEKMLQEVEAWNNATATTLNRYNSTKEFAEKYTSTIVDCCVFNYYDSSLDAIYEPTEKQEIYDEGIADTSFLEDLKSGNLRDGYTSYMSLYCGSKNAEFYNLSETLRAFKEKYPEPLNQEQQEELGIDYKDNYFDYPYLYYSIEEVNFFTGLHNKTVTEIIEVSSSTGGSLVIKILWEDNKVQFMTRGV